jgi:hypothetical protein
MLDTIDAFLNSLTTGQLFFIYFWVIGFAGCGAAWAIEKACLRLFRNSNDDWRNIK